MNNDASTVKEIEKTTQAQNKLNQAQEIAEKLQKDKLRLEQRLKTAKTEEAKQNAILNEQIKEQNRLNRINAKTENEVFGAYQNTSNALNLLIRKYRDLAIKQATGQKLSKGQERSMKSLEKQITKLDGALKKVDAQTGRFNRNVGNYKSGFNGLSNSINQLTREAPAFGVSMQTGFLAISNNLPILFDELKKLRLENQRLAASGKQTTSIFKQIGASLFSLQTLLSVGVTLLTLYGAELFELATNATKAESAINDYNDALAESIGNVRTEIVTGKQCNTNG